MTLDANIFQMARFSLTGGQITRHINATEATVVNLSAGSIGGRVTAFDDSVINISGNASLSRNLTALNDSTINLRGGAVARNLQGFNNGTVNMSGGAVLGQAVFRDDSIFNFSGGTIGPSTTGLASGVDNSHTARLIAYNAATLNIVGNNLAAMLIDSTYQDGLYSVYQLAGTLADGTSINGTYFFLENGTGANFQLLPPPNLSGDFNNDGTVDAADYVVWRKTDGTQLGYDTWRANFGGRAGGASVTNAAVPEPAAALLLLLGAAIGRWRATPTCLACSKTRWA